MKPSNGAKSTARIYDELMVSERAIEGAGEEVVEGAEGSTTQEEADPTYVRLWEKTKRHKDGSWDPEAKVKYDEFKELHSQQIEKHGVDNLSVKEAFVTVLKEKDGYIRGLGLGPRPTKRSREQANEERIQLNNEVQRLRKQEVALRSEIDVLKSSNVELRADMERIKQDFERAREEAVARDAARDKKAKARDKKAMERENKLRDELFTMLRERLPTAP